MPGVSSLLRLGKKVERVERDLYTELSTGLLAITSDPVQNFQYSYLILINELSNRASVLFL